jgi:biopolymer transport protein TolR
MAMSLGGNPRERAEINVTPMIDVLLVLIIIFMVITPLAPTGLHTLVPQAPTGTATPAPETQTVVVSVRGGDSVLLNQETVLLSDLPARLALVFRFAGNHVLFVRGDRNLEYRQVADVIDIAKGVGIDRVALMTR